MRMDSESDVQLAERRLRLLGPTYSLFYDEPVHFERAEGVWMFGADGRRYLDVYNNVPVVGHCHPKVVEALSGQAGKLNTHTRYLHAGLVDLADRILATMPSELGQMIFTCTGSEANDLAYRIAKAVTGGTGFIVTEHAYHGITAAISGMSPSVGGAEGLGQGVYVVPAPLARGYDVSDAFASGVEEALGKMRSDGVRPAGFLVDTIFSSDGIFCDPPGFLAKAVDLFRSAGGLFIADEVQAGYGRTARSMWGFQRHGVTPDIVTMGKPMGNGHPMAGIAARPELLTQFRRANRYFNTFGGNTVSAAVGHAVLDVIEGERLLDNAETTGRFLVDGLAAIQTRHPLISAVRGAGLFIGVEMNADGILPGSSADIGVEIANRLRHRGILIGTAGMQQNVLKIRPPLPFKREHVSLFLHELNDVLGEQ